MDYNTSRSGLILPEYGRNIHRMVNQMKAVADRNKRNKLAKTIISTMATLNPALKGSEGSDMHRKLWDHLFIMADFDLDIDSPYPTPKREQFNAKPSKVGYPKVKMRYRYYGKMMEDILSKIHHIEPKEMRDRTLVVLANQMKKLYLTWNRDTVTDELIWSDLKGMVNESVQVDTQASLGEYKEVVAPAKKNKKRGRPNMKKY